MTSMHRSRHHGLAGTHKRRPAVGRGPAADPPPFRIKDHRAGPTTTVCPPAQRPAVYADRRWCTWMYETRNDTTQVDPSAGHDALRSSAATMSCLPAASFDRSHSAQSRNDRRPLPGSTDSWTAARLSTAASRLPPLAAWNSPTIAVVFGSLSRLFRRKHSRSCGPPRLSGQHYLCYFMLRPAGSDTRRRPSGE
jgi:hypothetical protein